MYRNWTKCHHLKAKEWVYTISVKSTVCGLSYGSTLETFEHGRILRYKRRAVQNKHIMSLFVFQRIKLAPSISELMEKLGAKILVSVDVCHPPQYRFRMTVKRTTHAHGTVTVGNSRHPLNQSLRTHKITSFSNMVQSWSRHAACTRPLVFHYHAKFALWNTVTWRKLS